MKKNTYTSIGAGFVLAALLISGQAALAVAPSYTPVASFHTPPANPYGGLVCDGAGNYWGTSQGGGAYGDGEIFEINATTGALTAVVDFDGNTSDSNRGTNPVAALVSDGAGNLWGTTQFGGENNVGTIFEINATTGALTTVADFDDESLGGAPQAALVSDNAGNLWGTTTSGGNGYGTIFEISTTTPSPSINTVADFDGSAGPGDPNRGGAPEGALVSDGAGNFWGTTSYGGANNDGTIFEINESTDTVTTVADFDGSNSSSDPDRGSYPEAALVSDGAGNLWGTTSSGGANSDGTIFEINESTDTVTTVADFDGSNSSSDPDRGSYPQAALVSDGVGNLWGTTTYGGENGDGTIFEINESSDLVTTVADFDGSNSSDPDRGSYPQATLVPDNAGNLWGTTYEGGENGGGTIFEISTTTDSLTTVADVVSATFAGVSQGFNPSAGLVSDTTGNLWGTTYAGGSYGGGTIYEINTTTNALTTIANFANTTTGNNRGGLLEAALVSDGAGNFWGTSAYGGAYGNGTIFRINATTDALTTVVDFAAATGSNRGAGLQAALVSDGAGNLWGTTAYGGAYNAGTIFKINATTNALSTVVDFTAATTGSNRGGGPMTALVSNGAGNLWGTTGYGGAASLNGGTIFKINATTNALTTVADFSGLTTGSNRGQSPAGALVSDGAGNFWGTTSGGGANGRGTIFEINATTNALTTVADFAQATTGSNRGGVPSAGLVSDRAGDLWGTTQAGGANGNGTIFEINETTDALTTVLDFTGNQGSVPGTNPVAPLILTSAGFYGTAQGGGVSTSGTAAGGGEVFFIPFVSTPPATVVQYDFVVSGTGASVILPLANDPTSPGGFPLTITSISQPTLGNAVITGGTSVTYTPYLNFQNFAGTDTLTYTVSDGHGYTQTNEIVIGNPFYQQKGNYAGTTSSPAGYLTLTITSKGLFTGKLRVGATAYALKSNFNASGAYTATVGGHALALQMNFMGLVADTTGNDVITGSYGGSGFALYHAIYNSTSDPAPEAGSYTVLISPPPLGPLIQATATVTSSNGKITGLTMGNPGAGYISAPTVTFTSSTGSGASVTAQVSNGQVIGFTIKGGGSKYPSSGVTAKIAAPSGNPLGTGWATISVTESGGVTISGKLADGTSFSDGVIITGGTTPYVNQFPVYLNLGYKTPGSVTGTLTFEDNPGVSDLDGVLTWNKPPQAPSTAALYQGGFNLTVTAVGSRYAKPLSGNLVLGLPATTSNATVRLNEQDWMSPISKAVTIAARSTASMDTVTVVSPGADALQMSINASSGAFTGSFVDPATGAKTSLSGLLLNKQSTAGGFFVSPTESGNVTFP